MYLVKTSLICGRKRRNSGHFSNIRLGCSHLGRHLEYLKLLKGDNTPYIIIYIQLINNQQRKKLYQIFWG